MWAPRLCSITHTAACWRTRGIKTLKVTRKRKWKREKYEEKSGGCFTRVNDSAQRAIPLVATTSEADPNEELLSALSHFAAFATFFPSCCQLRCIIVKTEVCDLWSTTYFKILFFLFFLVLNSLNGCWIRNWAIFRNPVGRATRFPSTSVRHSWVSCPNYLFVLRNCVFGPRWKLDLRLFSSCYFSFPAQLGCKSYSCPRKGHLFFRL